MHEAMGLGPRLGALSNGAGNFKVIIKLIVFMIPVGGPVDENHPAFYELSLAIRGRTRLTHP